MINCILILFCPELSVNADVCTESPTISLSLLKESFASTGRVINQTVDFWEMPQA